MFKIDKLHTLNSGMSMPVAIVFSFCGLAILYAYTSSIYSKSWTVMLQYAEAKAQYNADSGIALEAVGGKNVEYSLYNREFYVPDGENGKVTASDQIPDMGSYTVDLSIRTNDNYQIIKVAKSISSNFVFRIKSKPSCMPIIKSKEKILEIGFHFKVNS